MKVLMIVLILMLFFAGCVGPIQNQIPRGNSLYQNGYKDGYVSGEYSAGYVYAKFEKDQWLYKNDSDYRSGWNDGFIVGKGRMNNIKRMIR